MSTKSQTRYDMSNCQGNQTFSSTYIHTHTCYNVQASNPKSTASNPASPVYFQQTLKERRKKSCFGTLGMELTWSPGAVVRHHVGLSWQADRAPNTYILCVRVCMHKCFLRKLTTKLLLSLSSYDASLCCSHIHYTHLLRTTYTGNYPHYMWHQ